MNRLVELVGRESAAVILFPVLSDEQIKKLGLSKKEKEGLRRRLKRIQSREKDS